MDTANPEAPPSGSPTSSWSWILAIYHRIMGGQSGAGAGEPQPDTFSFSKVLNDEYAAVRGPGRSFPSSDEYMAHVLSDPVRQSALCLSGGGIRSASFCLGVIQSLAGQGLLSKFHYLSTVSGGGYIGAWLQAWLLARARERASATPGVRASISQQDIHDVEYALASQAEPPPVDALRDFTSFLTPQPGPASPDTWAGLILWLRNVAINWAVFMPALLALALLPGVYRDLLVWIPQPPSLVCLLLALGSAAVGAFHTCCSLPSHAPLETPEDPAELASGATKSPEYEETRPILLWAVVPAVIWAILMPLAVAPFLSLSSAPFWELLASDGGTTRLLLLGVPFATFVALMIAYVAAWRHTASREGSSELFRKNFPTWVVASFIACCVLSGGIELGRLAAEDTSHDTFSVGGPALVAILGPVAAMLTHLSLSTVFVALRAESLRGDLDREWLARLSGLKVVPELIWGVFAAVCLFLPGILLAVTGSEISRGWTWATGAVTAASGVAGALFGRSSKTAATADTGGGILSFGAMAALATIVFAVGLFALLATGGDAAIAGVVLPLRCWLGASESVLPAWPIAAVAVALLCTAAYFLGHNVNVNRFSLHNVYRNRLTRAFLGSGRGRGPGARHPDPFTGFDPVDNPRIGELRSDGVRRLFPVIGTALNLVGGAGRHAWAERQAAPFMITPLACGSRSLKDRYTDPKHADGCFISPEKYGGHEKETGATDEKMGISLGTAMAVSGAAVSPSQGYHSSPTTAFLMTLFNVRLGTWLPNPSVAGKSALEQGKPPNSLLALANEMAGRVGNTSSSIYLSDGGHFDNLGLYEMVRRGCRLIVVIDAGQDGGLAYSDLGDAIRKISIDQRVRIEFDEKMPMAVGSAWKPSSRPFAHATITWTEHGDVTGDLLYIKPSMLDNVPVDVVAYGKRDKNFPNDSTLDQFFTESQFESYRKLGQFIGDKLRDKHYAGAKISDMLREIAEFV